MSVFPLRSECRRISALAPTRKNAGPASETGATAVLRLRLGRRRSRGLLGRRGMMHRSRLANYRGGLDRVNLRKILIEISFTLIGDLLLIRPLAVAGVDFLHHVKAIRHFAKGREAHAVQAFVVRQIDEELRGARVRPSSGKGESLHGVGLLSA